MTGDGRAALLRRLLGEPIQVGDDEAECAIRSGLLAPGSCSADLLARNSRAFYAGAARLGLTEDDLVGAWWSRVAAVLAEIGAAREGDLP